MAITIQEPITPEDIKYLLSRKGISQADLARKYGKSQMTICDIVNFRRVSQDLMEKIAHEIDMTPEVVFAWHYRGKGRQDHLYRQASNAA